MFVVGHRFTQIRLRNPCLGVVSGPQKYKYLHTKKKSKTIKGEANRAKKPTLGAKFGGFVGFNVLAWLCI